MSYRFLLSTLSAMLADDFAGKFLYAPNPAGNRLFGFSLNATTELGLPCRVRHLPQARIRAQWPSNHLATSPTLLTCHGSLDSQCADFLQLPRSRPNSLAMHPSGELLYVINTTSNGISGYSIQKTQMATSRSGQITVSDFRWAR